MSSLKQMLSKESEKNILKSDWFYVGCILLMTIVVFHQFLFSDAMFYTSDQMIGLDSKIFLRNSLNRFHQLPMWFNTRLGGMPSIDAMFGDPFYLPSIFFNTVFPVHRAIGMKMIFHIFLAGTFFYFLMRKGFGVHPVIALAGGLFYMFNPQFVSHIYPGHDGKMYVIAWVPFVVWRLKDLIDKSTLKNASILALGISMILLTSHIQMSYFVLWGLGFIWMFSCIIKFIEKQNRQGIQISLYFWLAVGVALLIGIIQLVPSYMYIQKAFSVRGVDRGIDFAASWSLHWGEVFSLWIPEFVNSLDYYWGQNQFKLNSEYGGGLALILSVFALISSPSKWRIFWAGVALFAISFGLGAHSLVWQVTYYIVPGVAKFRAASMIMFWFSFSTVLLSMLFLKDLFNGQLSSLSDIAQKKWTVGILVAAGACFIVTLLFSNSELVKGLFANEIGEKGQVFDVNFSKNMVPALWLWFLGALCVFLLIIGNIHGKVKPVTIIICIIIMGMIDLLRVDYQFIKMVDSRPYFYTEPALKDLQKKMSIAPFRCFTLPGSLGQNSEGVHGLEGVGGFHDNELRWYREFRGDQQDRNYLSSLITFNEKGQPYLDAGKLSIGNAFLNLANVRYLLVRSQKQLLAVENKNALGRVSFAQNYVVMDSSRIIDAINNHTYDYRNTVALQREPSEKPTAKLEDISSDFKSEWSIYSPNYRVVKVRTPGDGFLRISEVFYPGWKVFIDSKEVEVLQADRAWMAVAIKQGEHTVEMKIDSLYIGKVAWISGLMAGILLSYVILIRLNYKKSTKKNENMRVT